MVKIGDIIDGREVVYVVERGDLMIDARLNDPTMPFYFTRAIAAEELASSPPPSSDT
mgnify:CR=1 FL=1